MKYTLLVIKRQISQLAFSISSNRSPFTPFLERIDNVMQSKGGAGGGDGESWELAYNAGNFIEYITTTGSRVVYQVKVEKSEKCNEMQSTTK